MVITDCPRCGNEMELTKQRDMQGEGVWSQTVTFFEITRQDCNCDLSQTEIDSAISEVE